MAPGTKGEDHSEHECHLGCPRLHLRRTDSTNERARALAIAGAPHGTLVSADEQTAGRGRQGRTWVAPAGSALLCSLVLRHPPALLSLIAGVAVCDAVQEHTSTEHTPKAHRPLVKWPNDVVFATAAYPQANHPPALAAELRADPPPALAAELQADPPPALAKLAGILVEGRPQESWAVVGIGVNVAVHIEDLPADLRTGAASLELFPGSIESLLAKLLVAFTHRLAQPVDELLAAWRTRDALFGREVTWTGGHGRAQGIDGDGRLLVSGEDGATTALSAGEVHFESVG